MIRGLCVNVMCVFVCVCVSVVWCVFWGGESILMHTLSSSLHGVLDQNQLCARCDLAGHDHQFVPKSVSSVVSTGGVVSDRLREHPGAVETVRGPAGDIEQQRLWKHSQS